MARPKKKIDIEELEKLAAMQCTLEEIANWFDVSIDTIERRFAVLIKKGRSKGRMSMKRALFEKMQRGDLGAMVWWGKNFAGMSDKQEIKQTNEEVISNRTASIIGQLSSRSIEFLEKQKK